MGVADFIAATVVVVLGSVLQAASGVGAGFMMAPLLALIDLSLVPGPLIFASLSLSGIMAYRERGAIDSKYLPALMLGMVPGCLLGASVLSSVPSEKLGIVFGTVILFAIVITAAGLRIPLARWTAVVAGSLSGAMGTSAGMGAAPVALLYQEQSGPRVRSTLALLYTLAATVMVIILAAFGQFAGQEVRAGLLLVPGFLLGYWIANRFTPRLGGTASRVAVLTVSALAAATLITRSLQ